LSNKLYKIIVEKMDTGFLIALIVLSGGGMMLLTHKNKR